MNQSVISPLKNPGYRNLFFAQVTSLVGTGLTTVALALLAFDLAGGQAGQVLGTALALKMVAYVGIAPIAGGLVHLIDRKKAMVLLDLLRAGLILTLPFIQEIWQLYSVIFLLNICSACFTPIFQAVIPDLLPNEERYTKALSYSRLAYDLENLLSPTLAAALLSVWSFSGLFVLNGITFVLSALLVVITVFPQAAVHTRGKNVWKNITFGVRAYLKTPRLKGLLCLHLAVAAGGAMVIVNTVVYVRDHLGLGEGETAYVLMASGMGSMIIAFIVPKVLRTVPDRPVMVAGGVILATALFLGSFEPSFDGIIGLWFLLGVGWSCVQTPAGRVVTRSAGQADRAAYFSANFALSHGAWFICYLLAGWAGSLWGLPRTFLIMALMTSFAVMLSLWFWRKNDAVVVEHVHRAHAHDHPHTHDDNHHRHDHEGWEGPEPHIHEHRHPEVRHSHAFVIDEHHENWPTR